MTDSRDTGEAVFKMDDLRKAFDQIKNSSSPRPASTVHHPDCKVWTSRSLADCTCGGWMFPA